MRGGGSRKALRQASRLLGASPDPKLENKLSLLPVGEFERNLEGGAGIQRRPTLPERRTRFMAAGLPKVPLRPRNSIRSPLTVRAASFTPKNATRLANSLL